MSQQEDLEAIISDLRSLGANVDKILKFNPTERMLKDLRDGLVRLRSLPDILVATKSMINSL